MPDKLAYNPTEAAQALNVSRPTIYALMNRAEDPLPNFRVGTRRLISVAGLKAWVERQTDENAGGDNS